MICQLCLKNLSEQNHHLFSQTKWARRLYGALIDDPRNIMKLCSICHLNKPIPKFTEKQFCEALGIDMRSKIGRKS